jgi:hypothetical protein
MDNGEGEDFVIYLRGILSLLVMIMMTPASAEELSRLFFDKQERQSLNQKRTLVTPAATQRIIPKITSTPELTTNLEPMESVPLPAPKVTGQVIRSSGNNTIWVNHNPQYKRGSQ